MSSQPGHAANAPASAALASSPTATEPAAAATSAAAALPHIRIVPHLDAPRSLHFEVVDKDVPEGFVLKIGRFTDKQALPNRVTFKSKVVSRGHAEIYTERGKVCCVFLSQFISKRRRDRRPWETSTEEFGQSEVGTWGGGFFLFFFFFCCFLDPGWVGGQACITVVCASASRCAWGRRG